VIERNNVLGAFYSIILYLAWTAAASANGVDARAVTAFTEQARIASPDTFSRFGYSAAISGDTAIIGLRTFTVNVFRNGAARVYVRNGTTWTQQAQLTANDLVGDAFLGEAVALLGDTAFVGAPSASGGGFNSGSVYVYTRSNGTWTQSARLRPTDDAVQFGRSLAVSGNTLLVGSFGSGGYVYTGSGATWTLQTRLNTGANPGNNGSRGGFEVSISGDTAVLGNAQEFSNSSGAFVFVRTGSTWARQSALTTTEASSNAEFGLAVAVSGDRILVGAPNDRINGVFGTGAVYPFTRVAGVWTQGPRIVLPNPAGGDRFGRRLSISNNQAIANNRLIRATGNTWALDSALSTTDGAVAIPDAVAIDASTLVMTRVDVAGYIFADAAGGEAIFANGFE
jgi:hypothetical protein